MQPNPRDFRDSILGAITNIGPRRETAYLVDSGRMRVSNSIAPVVIHHQANAPAPEAAELSAAMDAVMRTFEEALMTDMVGVPIDMLFATTRSSNLTAAGTNAGEPLTLEMLEATMLKVCVDHPQTANERTLAREVKRLRQELKATEAKLAQATAHYGPDDAPSLGGHRAGR